MKLEPTSEEFQRYDRHIYIATAVTKESRDSIVRKFVKQRVLIEIGSHFSPSSRIMLLVAANLIARFCPKIDLEFSDRHPELIADALTMLRQIDGSSHAEFRIIPHPDYLSYGAVLSIGQPTVVRPNATVIDGVGWLALLNQPDVVLHEMQQAHNSPFGALLAATLGAAEVFKALLKPPDGVVVHFGRSTISAFDYSINGTDPGPRLPNNLHLPWSMLGGVGAVGNACLLALSFVNGLSGDLLVVDKEFVDLTNLNRYLLAFEQDADRQHPSAKTELARRLFHGRALQIHPNQDSIESLLGKIHRNEIPRPNTTLSAVDNNDARWVMQKLWPRLILEGATDQTLAQVSRHEYGTPYACLQCIHPKPAQSGSEISYVQQAAESSGIRADVIIRSHHDDSLALSEEHINPAAPDKVRSLLQKQLGKTICSILSEVEKMSTMLPAELPVQPAASFVSMTAGLLMAGELVKQIAGLTSALKTLYQLDSFYPLENAFLQPVEKVATCECVVRQNEIHAYRSAMEHSLKRDVSIVDR